MTPHESFQLPTLEALRQRLAELRLPLEADDDIGPLMRSVQAGAFTLPNRLVVLPMEGCDGRSDGSPDALTFRRYRRFAAGGAGLLWFEATAVVPEGRANPRQLWIHPQNTETFASLVKATLQAAGEGSGHRHRPLLILQLTHSGRYSRPERFPKPIIAHHSPFLDPAHQLPPEYALISDDELKRLEDSYVEAARCAKQAGFDGVDLKACHRYLVSELLASHTRANSLYGGSFENRTRFFRNVVGKIREALPGFLVTARLNAFDAMAYPYGFGVDPDHPARPKLEEPIELVRFLAEQGAPLVNITIGNPYHNPHINRPFDLPVVGAPIPPEHPLVGVARFVEIVRQIQQAVPGMAVIGGGYSWLRQYFPQVAAANVRQGWVTLVGAGRLAFAYPDFARDLAGKGRLDPERVCVACSACTQIMRDGGRAGCVPRDAAVYEPIYKAGRAEALDTILQMAKTCRQCNDPTCVGRCPAQVNIPRFVGHIASSRFREAYETLREANALATVCGYVCPSEVLCESGCIGQHYAETVPIRHLQRWISRRAAEEGWIAAPRPLAAPTTSRVAVVGAGPAGIAAAVTLAAHGHRVTLLDRSPELGGATVSAIPLDRIPDTILRQEIQGVLASGGDRLEIKPGELGPACRLDDLLGAGFDAVLLACGLHQSIPLPGAQRPRQGVVGALEFLARAKRGLRLHGRALVLGGGNTAIDAAVAALRAGAEDVAIVYRRSFAEMPAWPSERDQAIQAGIAFLTLTAALDYLIDAEGRLIGIKVVRTRLASPDAQGRRKPAPIEGSEHKVPADWVIEALGQRMEEPVKSALSGLRFTEEGRIWTRDLSLATSRAGVYAAGDVINGGTTVVQAVAEGTRAAHELDAYLRTLREGTGARLAALD